MSKWRSSVEITKCLSKLPDTAVLERLYCISRFFDSAVYCSSYEADLRLETLVELTPTGQSMLAECVGSSNINRADCLLAILGYLYHHTVFVDWKCSDIAGLQQLFTEELYNERLRLPFRFGRLLYDRFNDWPEDGRTDHLTAERAWALLDGTPVGVYQVGKVLSGPLGVVESQESRYFPPSLWLPLWHCSDTGCHAVHGVKLLRHDLPWTRAQEGIRKKLYQEEGPRSEWGEAILRAPRVAYPQGRPYVDLPSLLAECLIGDERTRLVEALLKTPQSLHLRSAHAARYGKAAKLSPQQLAAASSPEEQLQLLLLAPDTTLIRLIDESVKKVEVRIPLNEVRRAKQTPPKWEKDAICELSSLGIRPVHELPLAHFSSAIISAHESAGLPHELKWRLSVDSTRTVSAPVADYVRRNGLVEAVQHLIMSSRPVAEAICEIIGMDLQDLESRSLQSFSRVLWKFGFDIPRYDDTLDQFRRWLEEFNVALLQNDPGRGEDERAAIRAAGVNFFVSIEEILDAFLCFNVWLLASDHFVGTRFRYTRSEARAVIPAVLGVSLPADGKDVSWNVSGENALGTQVRYLIESVRWMKSLTDQDRSRFERPSADLPHYADDPHQRFVFRHTQLWADADPVELQRHILEYERLVQIILQADPAGVRNGLEHRREEERFPASDTMLACVSRLREAVEQADSLRYYPKTFWMCEENATSYGSYCYTFQDYRKKAEVIYGPSMVAGLPDASFSRPVVIAPTNLLGFPDSTLMFWAISESEYSRYWTGYPRRRKLPPAESDEEDVLGNRDQAAEKTRGDTTQTEKDGEADSKCEISSCLGTHPPSDGVPNGMEEGARLELERR